MKILIINSQGHWINGWMSFPESLNTVVQTLQKSNFPVETVEVKSLQELRLILESIEGNTLVWANAYWVNGEENQQHNMVEEIQQYNLPLLGSDPQTLLKLLEKDTCQQILKEGGIPIPEHFIINTADTATIEDFLQGNSLPFPWVIKPTNESRSNGITKVHHQQEAIEVIEQLRHKYPNSNIIIEEFLPTDDITCGFLKLGDQIMLLPSYNVITGMDCSKEIFSEAHYQLPPSYERQVLIQDDNVLNQLKEQLPRLVELLGIHNFTRVDGRLDQNGLLKYFDINGMPGLNYPNSAIIKQCAVHFPNYSEAYLFQCLINTIILDNLHRYNLPVPKDMQDHHLFNLESETVIRLKVEKTEDSIEYSL